MKHAVKFEDLRKGDMATVEVTVNTDKFIVTGPVRIDVAGKLNVLGYHLARKVRFISAEREGPEFAAGTIGQATLDTGRAVRGAWCVRQDGTNLFFAFTAVGATQGFVRSRVVRFVEEKLGSVDWEALEDGVADVLSNFTIRGVSGGYSVAVDDVMDALRKHLKV